jgi:hypothetical protein
MGINLSPNRKLCELQQVRRQRSAVVRFLKEALGSNHIPQSKINNV